MNCGIIAAPQRCAEPDAAPLASVFRLAARRYQVDVLASLTLFFVAAIAAGRVWRFPFDDEIQTIARQIPTQYRDSVWGYIRFFLDGRDNKANPLHLCLLLLAMVIPPALAGFSEPRVFLYLAPVLAVVLTRFFDMVARRYPSGALLLVCGALLPALMTIGELRGGEHPFKRNAAVPYGEIIDFIERNKIGDTLVVSTDPVVPWELRKLADAQMCAYSPGGSACPSNSQPFGSVFVVRGHGTYTTRRRAMQLFATSVAEATAGRVKISELRVAHDADASLKTWLTGVPLDAFILTVTLYR